MCEVIITSGNCIVTELSAKIISEHQIKSSGACNSMCGVCCGDAGCLAEALVIDRVAVVRFRGRAGCCTRHSSHFSLNRADRPAAGGDGSLTSVTATQLLCV